MIYDRHPPAEELIQVTNAPTDLERTYREVLGQYPTGVSAITAGHEDGTLAALTVGTFTSVSLDPPLVGFLPARTSTSWPTIERAGRFCVNVLAWDQGAVCQQMSRSAVDKFDGVPWRASDLGSPIIDDVVAWIDCSIVSVTEVGDHFFVLGEVHGLEIVRQTLPLVFFRGGYGRFSPGPLVSEKFVEDGHSGLLNAARMEMLQLGAELGLETAVTGRAGEDFVMLASTWTPLSERARVRVGDVVPPVPPLNVSFVASGSEALQSAWIDEGLAMNGGRGREELVAVLRDSRQRGWSGGVPLSPRNDVVRRFLDVNARLRSLNAADVDFNLSAPVFDDGGEVVLSLSIYGMSPGLSGKALQTCIDRLMESARQIEKALR